MESCKLCVGVENFFIGYLKRMHVMEVKSFNLFDRTVQGQRTQTGSLKSPAITGYLWARLTTYG